MDGELAFDSKLEGMIDRHAAVTVQNFNHSLNHILKHSSHPENYAHLIAESPPCSPRPCSPPQLPPQHGPFHGSTPDDRVAQLEEIVRRQNDVVLEQQASIRELQHLLALHKTHEPSLTSPKQTQHSPFPLSPSISCSDDAHSPRGEGVDTSHEHHFGGGGRGVGSSADMLYWEGQVMPNKITIINACSIICNISLSNTIKSTHPLTSSLPLS